jgi:hypothetical protein
LINAPNRFKPEAPIHDEKEEDEWKTEDVEEVNRQHFDLLPDETQQLQQEVGKFCNNDSNILTETSLGWESTFSFINLNFKNLPMVEDTAKSVHNQYELPPSFEVSHQVGDPNPPADPAPSTIGRLTAIALYDYERQDDDEIGFDVNDVITDIEQVFLNS